MNKATPTTLKRSRIIERLVQGVATSDGAGVSLTRVLTGKLQRRLDPFLMLDAFGSDDPDDYIAGFPDHPHRGFETITYMLSGRMRHRDSAGHEGLLENGGMQWMIAGRGAIHSEIPEQEDGLMEGFQLWLNLPAVNKMAAPWYKDFSTGEIPEYTTPDGVTVRVIAGEVFDVAVDLRKNSPTFGKWAGFNLSAGNKRMAWIPPGFAHGFLVLSDYAEFLYKTTEYWAPEHERCIAWNDPGLGIQWPLSGEAKLSDKDRQGAAFSAAEVFDKIEES